MSASQKRALFAICFLVVLPLLTGLACGDGGDNDLSSKVDKAVGEALKDFASGPSESDKGDVSCIVHGEGGVLVRALNCSTD